MFRGILDRYFYLPIEVAIFLWVVRNFAKKECDDS